MTPERLDELSAALDGLAAQPVEEHPPVLDAVHRALVDELDALAATVAGGDVQAARHT